MAVAEESELTVMRSFPSDWAPARVVLVTVVFLITGVVAGADDRHRLEPADTSSPQATLTTFINSVNEIHAVIRDDPWGRERLHDRSGHITRRILSCLDLAGIATYRRKYAGLEAAMCLKEVLDRIELPPFADIPDAETVQQDPGAWARWRVPRTAITIARIEQGERAGEYLFSADTVSRAIEFFQLVEQTPYRADGPAVSEGVYAWFLSVPGSDWLAAMVRVLPDWTRLRVGGRAIWQWVGLVATFLGGAIVVWLGYRVSKWRAVTGPDAGFLRQNLRLVFPLTLVLVPLWARTFIAEDLAIYGNALVVARLVFNFAFLAGLVVMVVVAFHLVAEAIIASPRINPKGMDAQFIRLLSKVLAMVAIVVVFLEGGQYLGISLSTLLAGAGVGGLALALSAQNVLKNVLGSMMILLDRPYRVGEYIIAQGYEGVVEDIGLRSTKIRMLSEHVASIPNETMATCNIENIGRRGHITRSTDIRLALDTTAEKAARAVEIIRGILENHEGMDPKFPPRVYLSEFSPDSMNVRMMYWYHPPNYWDFMAFGQELNLRIKRELEAAGIDFAAPAMAALLRRSTT